MREIKRKVYASMSASDKHDRICKQKIRREANRKTKDDACRQRLQNSCSQNHEASVSKYPITLTINKAQSQTIPNVGIYLPEPVFSHGQLYVALSRGVSHSTT